MNNAIRYAFTRRITRQERALTNKQKNNNKRVPGPNSVRFSQCHSIEFTFRLSFPHFIDAIIIDIICLLFLTIFMSVFMALSVSQLNYIPSQVHTIHWIVFTLAWISFVLDFVLFSLSLWVCVCLSVCGCVCVHYIYTIMFVWYKSVEIENTSKCKIDAVWHQFGSYLPHYIKMRMLCGFDNNNCIEFKIYHNRCRCCCCYSSNKTISIANNTKAPIDEH